VAPGSGVGDVAKRKRKPTASARVYVEGKLIIRKWIDKQNKKHRYTEVVASDVRFLTLAQAMERKAGASSPTSTPAISNDRKTRAIAAYRLD